MRNILLIAAVIGALGCRATPASKAATAAPARRAEAPADCKPIGPPPSRDLPADVAKALPRDSQGRPIIIGQGGTALVYDKAVDDPISRWGACLSRVSALKKANPGPGRFAHCVALIDVCASDEGGAACCPQACIDKFEQQQAGGLSEKEAMNKSFVEGSCLKGFKRP